MSLELQVMTQLKEAMKEKNDVALRALRAIKAGIIYAKTDKGFSEMNEQIELQIVSKLAKQRKESYDIFMNQNREDLAQKELEELEVIKTFLPTQLSKEEVYPIIQKIISSFENPDSKMMGKIIGLANKELAGKADGALISNLVKELLG